MRFKRHATVEYGLTAMDIAPFISVTFLLLFFVMVTSLFVMPAGIKVQLPKAITSDSIKEENIILTITSENVIYFNGAVTTRRELRGELAKSENKDRPILIKADHRASLGRVIDIWNLCRELGIEKINIASPQEK